MMVITTKQQQQFLAYNILKKFALKNYKFSHNTYKLLLYCFGKSKYAIFQQISTAFLTKQLIFQTLPHHLKTMNNVTD